MAVPKQKISKSKRGMRRGGNSKVVAQNPVENKTTGALVRPHHVSPGKKNSGEGYYNGRQVTTATVNH